MKALTNIQLDVMQLDHNKQYVEYLWKLQPLYEGKHPNRVKFLNQPFKPELITVLFEGWETSVDEGGIYLNRQFYIDCEVDYINGKGINYGYLSMNMITWFPETLDDFIRDCQRAAIELTFKE